MEVHELSHTHCLAEQMDLDFKNPSYLICRVRNNANVGHDELGTSNMGDVVKCSKA